MNDSTLAGQPVFVAGAGIMGAGIAQVAAQAGHTVHLFDLRAGVAAAAKARLADTLAGLAAKGRLDPETVQQTLSRIEPAETTAPAVHCALVVEAIVEQLDAKRALLAELEAIVGRHCVLATNTSSISVTAIANGLRHPDRVVGMHFFNPVPLMKLVEVVSGLQTDPAVAAAIFELSQAWGKVPVHAKSTPGFIVNRIARPYYAEALALLQEQAATPAVLDACLRGAGFRMGPCELMDLIGHDTNFAVTRSVYEANFQDKRYTPSGVQAEMVAGGLLGRKSGRGFYRYDNGQPENTILTPVEAVPPGSASEVTVHGTGPLADHLEQATAGAMAAQGWGPARERASGWTGLQIDKARLVLTDGRTATERAAEWRTSAEGADTAVFDRPVAQADGAPPACGTALAWATAEGCSDAFAAQAAGWLAALGFVPLRVADTPGLVVARTVAMLINEAADAVQQGVCSEAGADVAMTLGVNHPAGPFAFLHRWNAREVADLLDSLDTHYRGERYRVSPWLRRRAHRTGN